jgi:hypothetical protein
VSDDIETFDVEEAEDIEGTDDTGRITDLDIEAPEADAAEQQFELLQQRDVPITERPLETPEADAAEQSRVVELDEDDYR